MKKSLAIIATVLALCLSLSPIAMAGSWTASCRSPSTGTVTCNNKSGTHYGKYAVSGVKAESGQSLWNTVTVNVDVKYRIKATGTEKWTGYSSNTASNASSTSVTRAITPALDEALDARGKWSATCQRCGKSSSGQN